MRQQLLPWLIMIVLISSCDDDDDRKTVCSVKNPIEELEWLAAEINELEASDMSEFLYVTQVEYEGRMFFVFGNCCPYCGVITPIYDCSGQQFQNPPSGEEGHIPPDVFNGGTVIWKPANSSCDLD